VSLAGAGSCASCGSSASSARDPRRLEPNHFFASLYTQLEALARLPRHLAQLLTKLETGTLKVGVAPTDLADAEHALRSVANRVGAAVIVASLLIASAPLARVHDVRCTRSEDSAPRSCSGPTCSGR
jgi:hypothetical protein